MRLTSYVWLGVGLVLNLISTGSTGVVLKILLRNLEPGLMELTGINGSYVCFCLPFPVA